jgi:hypothetical protein
MLKRLTNKSEHRVYEQISAACEEFGAAVYRKIRVADVIDISQCDTREIGTYALMSHFDFVVTDSEHMPLFALEYDGGAHDPKNDWKKDGLCQQADLALFRVSFEALNAQLQEMSFLGYLVHVWFMAHAFDKMQRQGQIAPDEPFIMWAFLKPDAKHVFDSEYEFTLKARAQIERLNRTHRFSERTHVGNGIGNITLAKNGERFASFTCLDVRGVNVFGLARMDMTIPCAGTLEEIPFGISALADFCDGLAYSSLVENVQLVLEGAGHVVTPEADVRTQIRDLAADGFALWRGGGLVGHGLSEEVASMRGKLK